jgi:DNA adenine methylase
LYEEYDAFSVTYVDAARAINSDVSNRGDVAEVLITNVPPGNRRRKTLADFTD